MKRLASILIVVQTLCGCTLSVDWLRQWKAERLAARGEFKRAVDLLGELVNREPDSEAALKAARVGARIAQFEAKDYAAALRFNKQIVLKSPDEHERREAQKNIASIYFDHMQDYDQAVVEYERLLKLKWPESDIFRFRLNLAKSHFQLNSLEQAANEIESLLALNLSPDDRFDALVVRANLETANKKIPAAAETWEKIIKEFPERALREKAALNLVVCYEEMKDFEKAIATLENMRSHYPNPDFLEIRIERLKERKINQPGAMGWKR